MKKMFNMFLLLALGLTGCMTSSKVQQMIDASHQDYLATTEAHAASIDVLKKSAMTGLEKGKQNTEAIAQIQARLEEIAVQLQTIKGYSEAAKVMSAANTVKVADLDEALRANKESTDEATRRLAEIDRLYEEVMLRYYQAVSDAANAAMNPLKSEGVIASTNGPVKLNEPIEIVAPDTSVAPTNGPAK